MSSFWWNFHHWLHWKLSKWQLPVQPVMKISSKWRHFRFSVAEQQDISPNTGRQGDMPHSSLYFMICIKVFIILYPWLLVHTRAADHRCLAQLTTSELCIVAQSYMAVYNLALPGPCLLHTAVCNTGLPGPCLLYTAGYNPGLPGPALGQLAARGYHRMTPPPHDHPAQTHAPSSRDIAYIPQTLSQVWKRRPNLKSPPRPDPCL